MTTLTDSPVIRMVRTIPAPPARVYRAWLDPDLVRLWFAGNDYQVSSAEVDERVGGRHSIRQSDADGQDVGGFESELLELVPDRRIVFRWGFVGPDHIVDPTHESRLTIAFESSGDGHTELTLVHERLDGLRAALPHVAARVSAGWEQALDKLTKAVLT